MIKIMAMVMAILSAVGNVRVVNVDYYAEHQVVDSTGEIWEVLDDVAPNMKGVLWIDDNGTAYDVTDDVTVWSEWFVR
jgi:hypothetical protein